MSMGPGHVQQVCVGGAHSLPALATINIPHSRAVMHNLLLDLPQVLDVVVPLHAKYPPPALAFSTSWWRSGLSGAPADVMQALHDILGHTSALHPHTTCSPPALPHSLPAHRPPCCCANSDDRSERARPRFVGPMHDDA